MASKLPTRPLHQKHITPEREAPKRIRAVKRGHNKNSEHLERIRELPCCVCLRRSEIEAAHVRSASARFAKVEGLGMKPSDAWAVPLCAEHHRTGAQAQHIIGETKFWQLHRIDPFVLALSLWEASGDFYRMQAIVERASDYGPANP